MEKASGWVARRPVGSSATPQIWGSQSKVCTVIIRTTSHLPRGKFQVWEAREGLRCGQGVMHGMVTSNCEHNVTRSGRNTRRVSLSGTIKTRCCPVGSRVDYSQRIAVRTNPFVVRGGWNVAWPPWDIFRNGSSHQVSGVSGVEVVQAKVLGTVGWY